MLKWLFRRLRKAAEPAPRERAATYYITRTGDQVLRHHVPRQARDRQAPARRFKR
jgi:hypothetical protein